MLCPKHFITSSALREMQKQTTLLEDSRKIQGIGVLCMVLVRVPIDHGSGGVSHSGNRAW